MVFSSTLHWQRSSQEKQTVYNVYGSLYMLPAAPAWNFVEENALPETLTIQSELEVGAD